MKSPNCIVQEINLPQYERRHIEFFNVLKASLSVNTREKFCTWSNDYLKLLFPYDALICGLGQIDNRGIFVQDIINCKLSTDYMEGLIKIGGIKTSPIFTQWVSTNRPVLYIATDDQVQSKWLDNFNRCGIQNMAAHGLRDINSSTTSYFSFTNIPDPHNARYVELLDLLIPYLHVTLNRVINKLNEPIAPPQLSSQNIILTKRQIEVILLYSQGFSYKHIAEKLGIRSHKTVEQHLDAIRLKLLVDTRRECIQKAINLRLIN